MKEGRSKVHDLARSFDALQQRGSTPTLPGSPLPLLKEGLASPSTPPMDISLGRSGGLTEQGLSPSSARQPCTPSFRPTRGFASLGETAQYRKARAPNVQKLTGHEYEVRQDSGPTGCKQKLQCAPKSVPSTDKEELGSQSVPQTCTARESCDVVECTDGDRAPLDPCVGVEKRMDEKIRAYYGKADDARLPSSPRYACPYRWTSPA